MTCETGRRRDGAPQPTVEALMYSLRERGAEALQERDTLRRLSGRRRAVMVSPGGPQPAYPLAPCHLTPCPVGDRPGALLHRVQERAEIFQFGDQSVLGGDHTFGAFALALVVRPVLGR